LLSFGVSRAWLRGAPRAWLVVRLVWPPERAAPHGHDVRNSFFMFDIGYSLFIKLDFWLLWNRNAEVFYFYVATRLNEACQVAQ
jgi:hypothetical protein